MKKFKEILKLVVLSVSIFISMPTQKVQAQPSTDVSIQDFYDNLAPYGQWVDDQEYGYVFVPNVEQDFRPYYTDGYWAMTEYGNTWVSSYPWGWACFHYGRWTYDNYYGWVWIPGTEWGPAWVDWRNGGGYYGWAPLGPGFDISVGFGAYSCPDDWWVFLPPRYLYQPRYYHYWAGPRENTTIIHNTTIINNTFINNSNHVTYVTGPRAADIERETNTPVKVYQLSSRNNPGKPKVSNDVIKMYHPMTVAQTTTNGMRPAPSNAVRAPQPVNTRPQPVSSNNGGTPAFRNEVQRTAPQSVSPARNQMPASQPRQQQRYEWNVNKPQPQTVQPQHNEEPQQNFQRPQPQQQQNFQRPQPQQQQNFQRQQPQQNFQRPEPQQNFQRPQPQQNFQRPQPQQQMSRPAPMPAQHYEAPRSAPPPQPNRR
ncbi:MAG TPA: DUF6600 domain-containing protein [Flavipsychrobacter sp.]|nr:DUF6600 domain-containing protein [Flavipsychrobacter sp.]